MKYGEPTKPTKTSSTDPRTTVRPPQTVLRYTAGDGLLSSPLLFTVAALYACE